MSRFTGVDRDVWMRAYIARLAALGASSALDSAGLPAIAADAALKAYRERFPDDSLTGADLGFSATTSETGGKP